MAALVLPRPVSIPTEDGEGIELYIDYAAEVLPGFRLEVMSGFRYEASIPRLMWSTTGHPLTPRYQAAVLIHDAVYQAELLPRADGDGLLYRCLRLDGVNLYQSNKIWLGVRSGGWYVWSQHTPESIAEARKYCRLIALKR